MKELRDLDLQALVDMLSEFTAKYTRIHADGGGEDEYNTCKKTIELLQREIIFRKNSGSNSAAIKGDIAYAKRENIGK